MDSATTPETDRLHPSELMLEQSKAWHRQFNEEKWSEKESFHNEKHVGAVARAADTLIVAAEQNDPLDIKKSLADWNAQNPESQIESLDELQKVVRIAIAGHDNGNIMREVAVVDGQLEPVFLETYTANEAEERSTQIVEVLINNQAGLTDDEKKRFVPLAKHLILQTKFVYDADDPHGEKSFAKFMRVVDQIGNDQFSENPERVKGLIMEQVAEKPDLEINPDFYYNFAIYRFAQLEPDEEKRQAVYQAWGGTEPQMKQDYSKEAVNAKSFLSTLGMPLPATS